MTTSGAAAAQKHSTGQVRTDVEPLTRRFPLLDDPVQVRWMSGTYGDPDLPGPSTYWIDAVIKLDPDQVSALMTAYSPQPASEPPGVVEEMRRLLPPGPLHSSDQLDAAFTEGDWWASAFLDPRAGQLMLVATGT